MALLSLAASPAAAQNDAVRACLDKMTGNEQKECTEKLYRAAAAELDAIYRNLVNSAAKRNESGAEPSRATALTKSQNSWEVYRDAECWGVVGMAGGSGRMVWVYGCLAEKTFERIGELRTPFYQR